MKHNPAPATQTNAGVDLTPMLDIIFILLFVVLLSFVRLSLIDSDNYDNHIEELEQKIEKMQQELDDYHNKDYDYETLANSYQESIKQYEEIDKIVLKVTIYCNYDPNDYSHRTIRVIIPGKEFDPIELTKSREENGFARLTMILEKTIKEFISAGQSGSENEDGTTAGENFVFLYLSLDDIQRGDKNRIESIGTYLMGNYDNVYFRKFRDG